MNNQSTIATADLYEQDFYLWIERSATLLKEKRFQELDLENLIEEIESMGRSEKRAVTSNLEVILLHLLKYKYQPEKRSNSWRYTLIEHRRRIAEELEDSPSLKNYLLGRLPKGYAGARELASVETGISISVFPEESPFTIEQVLDKGYLPEN